MLFKLMWGVSMVLGRLDGQNREVTGSYHYDALWYYNKMYHWLGLKDPKQLDEELFSPKKRSI